MILSVTALKEYYQWNFDTTNTPNPPRWKPFIHTVRRIRIKDKNLIFDGAFMTNFAITDRKIVSSSLPQAF